MESVAPAVSTFEKVDAWWRAANSLSVGQIHLFGNPLLHEPLSLAHSKPRLVGHRGTTPGLNFICAHMSRAHEMNRVIMDRSPSRRHRIPVRASRSPAQAPGAWCWRERCLAVSVYLFDGAAGTSPPGALCAGGISIGTSKRCWSAWKYASAPSKTTTTAGMPYVKAWRLSSRSSLLACCSFMVEFPFFGSSTYFFIALTSALPFSSSALACFMQADLASPFWSSHFSFAME